MFAPISAFARGEKVAHFCVFALFGQFFLQISLQLKNFFQKSKCVHHPRTRRHLCDKFDVRSEAFSVPPQISLGEKPVTHPDTPLISASVNLSSALSGDVSDTY